MTATTDIRKTKSVLPLLALGVLAIPDGPQLAGFCRLPADTFEEGPTSGQFIQGANGRMPPFILQQPVQGFSALVLSPGDRAMVLTDNGFGTKANSPDSLLCLHSLHLDWAQSKVTVERRFNLADPFRKVPWVITADRDTANGGPFPVDATVREQRLLTGADFDPESFRQTRDGTLWFGDEFGPFLLHTDVAGRLLDEPFSLPGVQARENPLLRGLPSLASSKGFEGLALGKDRTMLYALLEGPAVGEVDKRRLTVHEFDASRKRWTNNRWTYRMERTSHAIGDMTYVDRTRFLVIERDNGEGSEARFKRIYLADLASGSKTEVVDLLAVADPKDRNGNGSTVYAMPFATIEGIAIRDSQTIVVSNDNNYPFSSGRLPGVPDDNEFAMIRLPRKLSEYR